MHFELSAATVANRIKVNSAVKDFKSLSIIVPLEKNRIIPSKMTIRTRCRNHSPLTTGILELQDVFGRSLVFRNVGDWCMDNQSIAMCITIEIKLTEFEKDKDLVKLFKWDLLAHELKICVLEFLGAKSLCKMQLTSKENYNTISTHGSINKHWFKLCQWKYRFSNLKTPLNCFNLEQNKFNKNVNWKNELKEMATEITIERIVRAHKRHWSALTVITSKGCKTVESKDAGQDIEKVKEGYNYCNKKIDKNSLQHYE